ncbi:S-layer homology domain-containing protein [Paenibacillus lemnae]|uniref:S-layer homology domain-containing protein n=1 Tax=Paenibacillus lemnae TaxID=1330551 RepID=A0A848M7L6_PAELE|nr:S-layer homology domain-containing protein [Paenibacillus lemnae]NMO96259.1 S-layer homology domain-containing protein [Paenibacillus lemnae]
MKKTTKIISTMFISSALMGTLAASASAFSDVDNQNDLSIVKELQTAGIIQGISDEKFAPNMSITSAQAVKMVVKTAGLEAYPNLTGKSFSSVPDGAWYADAVNIAAMHGLPVHNETAWNKPITREDFAQLLYSAVQATGDYPVIMMYVNVEDDEEIAEDKRGAVQFLLLTKMTELDKNGEFRPKENLSRMEAAQMTHAAVNFIETHKQGEKPSVGEIITEEQQGDAAVDVIKVNDDVNKVVITKDDLPHPGYGLVVSSIQFIDDMEVVVHYQITQPDPDKMYPQVISKASVETYVPSQYKITVKERTSPRM